MREYNNNQNPCQRIIDVSRLHFDTSEAKHQGPYTKYASHVHFPCRITSAFSSCFTFQTLKQLQPIELSFKLFSINTFFNI